MREPVVSPAERARTIREQLEWLRDFNGGRTFANPVAVAMLAQMDKARHAYRCRPGCWDCDIRDEPFRSGDVRIALIDDPDPGVGVEHAPKEHP